MPERNNVEGRNVLGRWFHLSVRHSDGHLHRSSRQRLRNKITGGWLMGYNSSWRSFAFCLELHARLAGAQQCGNPPPLPLPVVQNPLVWAQFNRRLLLNPKRCVCYRSITHQEPNDSAEYGYNSNGTNLTAALLKTNRPLRRGLLISRSTLNCITQVWLTFHSGLGTRIVRWGYVRLTGYNGQRGL